MWGSDSNNISKLTSDAVFLIKNWIKKKKIQKKKFFIRTDKQTDTRSTQNYSSEPHKNMKFLLKIIQSLCQVRSNKRFLIEINVNNVFSKIKKHKLAIFLVNSVTKGSICRHQKEYSKQGSVKFHIISFQFKLISIHVLKARS